MWPVLFDGGWRAGCSYDAWASEGGHVEFGPTCDLENRLLVFLQAKFGGRVSAERIISGKGLVNVYSFLREEYPNKVVAIRTGAYPQEASSNNVATLFLTHML